MIKPICINIVSSSPQHKELVRQDVEKMYPTLLKKSKKISRDIIQHNLFDIDDDNLIETVLSEYTLLTVTLLFNLYENYASHCKEQGFEPLDEISYRQQKTSQIIKSTKSHIHLPLYVDSDFEATYENFLFVVKNIVKSKKY